MSFTLLDPINNKYAFSDDAWDLVLDVWRVLLNPQNKFQYTIDSMMYEKKRCLGTGRKRKEKRRSGNDRVETFWTVCPYCYYVYEYEIVYQDYCLRCQNCRMAFHGVAINGQLPPKSALVEGKEQYNCCLGFFKLYYFDKAGVVVKDKEKKVDVSCDISVVEISDQTKDVLDAGCNKKRRRRGIASNNDTSGRRNVEESREKMVEKLGTVDRDDCAEQTLKQSQSKISGEPSKVQMVKTMELMIGGIESKRRLMADHLEEGLNEESKHEWESKPSGLEFYEGDDDIYIGLSDL